MSQDKLAHEIALRSVSVTDLHKLLLTADKKWRSMIEAEIRVRKHFRCN